MSSSYILYIEDNHNDEELTRMAFDKGHLANEIVVAHDGVEALDYLQGASARGDLPELILLDSKISKQDGSDVLQRLRADPLTHTLPILVLTTSAEEELRAVHDLGAVSYVRKPVTFESFAEALRRLRVYWMVIDKASSGQDD